MTEPDIVITYPEIVAFAYPTEAVARAAQRDVIHWSARRRTTMAVETWRFKFGDEGWIVAAASMTVDKLTGAIRRRLLRHGGREGRLPERVEERLRMTFLQTCQTRQRGRVRPETVGAIWLGDEPPSAGRN